MPKYHVHCPVHEIHMKEILGEWTYNIWNDRPKPNANYSFGPKYIHSTNIFNLNEQASLQENEAIKM